MACGHKADPDVGEPPGGNKHKLFPLLTIDNKLGLEVAEPPSYGNRCTPRALEAGEPPAMAKPPSFLMATSAFPPWPSAMSQALKWASPLAMAADALPRSSATRQTQK